MSSQVSHDLPIKPYYKNNNCESNYNCGNLCISDSPQSSQPKQCKYNPSLFEGECHGKDSNYCNGILSCCDPNDPNVSCDGSTNYKSGAKNSNGSYLGCEINNTEASSNCINDNISACVEFK